MRLFYLLSIIAFFPLSLMAQQNSNNGGIKWMSWDEAVLANQTVPKKLFVDVYTNWCGWCKKMDASTFRDPAIVKYMNQFYYAVKLNAEMKDTIYFNNGTYVNANPASTRGTHQLASSLLDNQMSYPSFVVLTNDYRRIRILPGYKTPQDLYPILTFYGEDAYINATFQEYMKTLQGTNFSQ